MNMKTTTTTTRIEARPARSLASIMCESSIPRQQQQHRDKTHPTRYFVVSYFPGTHRGGLVR